MERTTSCFFKDNSNKSRLDFIQIKSLNEILEDLEFEREQHFRILIESPLECTLSGMTKQTTHDFSEIKVDRHSINSIILDDEPEVDCSTLIVACRTSTNQKSSSRPALMLRNTCLFPKIKGIISLCLLMFAPAVELRVDEVNKKYSGALCGLGFDEDERKAIYTDNDIEDVFECDFDNDDINRVCLGLKTQCFLK